MMAAMSSSSEMAMPTSSSEPPSSSSEATAPSSSSSEMATSSSSAEPSSSSAEAPAPAAPVQNPIPAAALKGDVAIAAPGSKADGQGYIGVWAKDAAGCATIADATSNFAVVTFSTFRNGPNACFGNFAGALKDGKVSFSMSCQGTPMTLELAQSTPDKLTVSGTELVRCNP